MPSRAQKALCLLTTVFLFSPVFAFAEEAFKAEIMDLEGDAKLVRAGAKPRALKDGDLLQAGDVITTDDNSSVDVAYDGNWKNIARIEENTKATLRSVHPSEIGLEQGGIFAKLAELPEESKFEVQTPTAIVAVRGTDFRTTYGDRGSEVFNFSDSQVYVYGLDEKGNVSKQHEPVIVGAHQKTEVYRRGEFRFRPHGMTLADRLDGEKVIRHIDQRVETFERQGRHGKVPDLQNIRGRMSEMKQKGQFENKGVWPERPKKPEVRTIAAPLPSPIPGEETNVPPLPGGQQERQMETLPPPPLPRPEEQATQKSDANSTQQESEQKPPPPPERREVVRPPKDGSR